MKKRPRLSGFDRMTNALEIVRNHNEDVEQWIAQHIGNLRDERERMTEEISRLKRRVSRLEKRTSPTLKMSRCVDELDREIKRLRDGITECLMKNRHLADGDDCTLIGLKRLLLPNTLAEPHP